MKLADLEKKVLAMEEVVSHHNKILLRFLKKKGSLKQINGTIMGKDLAEEVKQDIENRILKGVQTYGERLRPFNGRVALQDAYEEVLDLTLYMKQELKERASQREV